MAWDSLRRHATPRSPLTWEQGLSLGSWTQPQEQVRAGQGGAGLWGRGAGWHQGAAGSPCRSRGRHPPSSPPPPSSLCPSTRRWGCCWAQMRSLCCGPQASVSTGERERPRAWLWGHGCGGVLGGSAWGLQRWSFPPPSLPLLSSSALPPGPCWVRGRPQGRSCLLPTDSWAVGGGELSGVPARGGLGAGARSPGCATRNQEEPGGCTEPPSLRG